MGSTLDVAGATNLTSTLDVTGATTLGSTVELLADAATVTHSGTTSLSISSTGGYVAVESVQFAGDNIGISGDTNLMVLTSGTLTVDGKVASTTLDVTGAVTYGSTLDVAGATNLTSTLDVTGATTLGSTVELLADAATVTHSGTTSLSISSTDGFVAVESVQFAGDNIGINGDTNLMVLTSGTLTVDGKVASTTLETSGAATVGGDLTLSNTAAVAITHSGSTSLSISSGGYVAVESVQFADANIGISGDTNLMVLTSGTLTVDGKVASTTLETSGAATVGGDLTLSNTAAVAITHSGSTSLSISSGGYVAVESVQFADANIGISGDTNLMVLTSGTLTVDGKVASTTLETSGAATVGGDLTLSNTAAVAITHSGSTSLSISSGGYVAVESVQFADANIGISGDTNLMVLTSGTLTVDGKVASTTLETSGAATVGTTLDVAGATNLTSTLDVTGATTLGSTVELLADAATVTHSGTTSLSISSTDGFVAVESVQFAGDNIGISGDTNLMVLTSGTLTVDGKVASTTLETSGAATVGTTLDVAGATNLTSTLDVTGATTLGSTVELLADAATVTHSGTTSLSISSTDGFVAVESVQFAGDNIGISGDTNLMVLTSGTLTVDGKVASTTLDVTGAVTYGSTLDVAGATNLTSTLDVTGATTLGSTVELLADAATVTHSGTTSLSISSTDGFVAVESVQFAGDNIGISGDTNLMVLTSGTLTVDGKVASTTLETSGAATVGGDLTLSNTAAVAITHSGSTSLSISSGGYVAVESVQFADANIGISGDTNLMVLTSGTLTVDGKVASTTLETSGAATVGTTLDVAGATNLTSTLDVTGATTLGSTVELLADAATVTHSGTTSLSISSTDGFVAVESVQFAGDNIGISGDTNLMVLTSGTLTVDGKVASTTLETSGAATVGGDLTLSNTAAVAITHSGSTSLSISSGGYVAVESVQFADANIGISGDTNLMVLTSGTLTVDGKVASTTLETSGAATVGGDLTLSNTAAVAITHSGSTSLSISSGGYVAVESVQFADANIGISGDTNLMVLTSGTLTVDGKVASTTLETSGAATVGTTLDVAGATNLTSTLDVTGATTLGSTVELLADAATVTHSGTTSLSISSTDGFVAVESVQFAGDNIGISGDTNLMVLTSGTLTVDGKVASTSSSRLLRSLTEATLDVAGATNLTSTLDVTGATTLGSTVERQQRRSRTAGRRLCRYRALAGTWRWSRCSLPATTSASAGTRT